MFTGSICQRCYSKLRNFFYLCNFQFLVCTIREPRNKCETVKYRTWVKGSRMMNAQLLKNMNPNGRYFLGMIEFAPRRMVLFLPNCDCKWTTVCWRPFLGANCHNLIANFAEHPNNRTEYLSLAQTTLSDQHIILHWRIFPNRRKSKNKTVENKQTLFL